MHSTGAALRMIVRKIVKSAFSAGMRRVGIDDGRLFSLRGKPFVLFAGVAPALQAWLNKEETFTMRHDVHRRAT